MLRQLQSEEVVSALRHHPVIEAPIGIAPSIAHRSEKPFPSSITPALADPFIACRTATSVPAVSGTEPHLHARHDAHRCCPAEAHYQELPYAAIERLARFVAADVLLLRWAFLPSSSEDPKSISDRPSAPSRSYAKCISLTLPSQHFGTKYIS